MTPLRLLCGALALLEARAAVAADLRLVLERESLTGIHRQYRQFIGGVEVAGALRVESVRHDGTREVFDRLAQASDELVFSQRSDGTTLLLLDGTVRRVRRKVAAENPLEPVAVYSDATTGEVVLREPLFYRASGRAFPVNPVAATNDPSLQDRNDSAAAVPPAAYRTVELPDLVPSGPLTGPHVTVVDRELPATARADAGGVLDFDRSQPQFEEVNVYHAIDRNQRYLQSLGYSGARRVVGYAIPVDPHAAAGADTSYYLQSSNRGEGVLLFGDGGTDDAEDTDLVLHEYAHAIHDWIAPGALGGGPASESRALAEGFGDYWAFSATYAETVASGRDPGCIADWDARCWEGDGSQQCGYPRGSDCLRRTDSRKTMADFIVSDRAGTEHRNGEIWSSALRDVFLALAGRYGLEQGKQISDTIVIESLFGLPPGPTFRAVAGRMLDADRLLYGGANRPAICAAMSARGILPAGDCDVRPRGEITYFQSVDHGRAIPDFEGRGLVSAVRIDETRPVENLYVRVDIAHPNRGDLEVVVIAPDGTEAVLQRPSLDRSRDLRATFGLDTQPAQPLTIFRGRSAAGEWRLRV
ncbi:MAG TPA: M36 family metallopeptidase, partial [Thermoanaerobaculia bacterium]|nr:M36 family metallopeptidase [Thermoanaerobaculia bacterium]